MKNILKNKKAFTLIELILVISLASAISFLSFQKFMRDQESVQASSAGEQLKKIGDAVNSYVSVKYDKLSSLSNSDNSTLDPGPRTCNSATSSCSITLQTLINEGILPATFNGLNSFKAGYSIILKRSGTAPYYNVNGLVTTTKPWIGVNNNIRYDLLGLAMQKAGIDSGLTNNSTNVVSGYNGNWTHSNTTFSNINQSGQLAYQVGYGSYSYSIYLRRDGTLPMTGNLNMGLQSINNAKDITASGTTQSGTLRSTGATTVGTTLNVAGATTLSGTANINNNLNVAGTTTLAGTNVNGVLNANNNLVVAGTSNLRGATALNSTLNVAGTSTLSGTNINGQLNANSNFIAAGTSNLRGATTLNSTLNVAGTSTFANVNVNGGLNANSSLSVAGGTTINGVLNVNNAINSTGNIKSNGLVQGNYLYPNATVSSGQSCSPNGYIAKNNVGRILSCTSGTWKEIGNDVTKVSGWYMSVSNSSNGSSSGGCVIQNSVTGACSCSPGTVPNRMLVNNSGSCGSGGSGCSSSSVYITGCN